MPVGAHFARAKNFEHCFFGGETRRQAVGGRTTISRPGVWSSGREFVWREDPLQVRLSESGHRVGNVLHGHKINTHPKIPQWGPRSHRIDP
jgi:hypothetical protein